MGDTDAQLTEEQRKDWARVVAVAKLALDGPCTEILGWQDDLEAIVAMDAYLRDMEERRDKEARMILDLLAEAEAEE